MEEIKEVKKAQSRPETVESYLASVNIMLKNASLPEIDIELKKFNIGGEYVSSGKTLLTEVLTINALHLKQQGNSTLASEKFKDLKDKAMGVYRDYFKIAKVIFENEKDVFNALGLTGRRETTIKGFYFQGDSFYQNALSSRMILERFEAYNITEDMLKKSYEEFKVLYDMYAGKKSEKFEVTKLIKRRDEKLAELREWVSKFRTLAKIALKEKDYLLSKLDL